MLSLGYVKSTLRLRYDWVKSKMLSAQKICVINRLTMRYYKVKTWWRAGKLRAGLQLQATKRLTQT